MRKLFATTILLAIALFCNAQSWELKVNAGGNTTFVNDGIQDYYMIASRVKNPYEVLGPIGYELTPLPGQIITTEINIHNKIGYFADGELVRHLRKNWALSVSLGVNKITYSYDMTISEGDTKLNVKDIEKNYGESRFLYAHSRFLNLTKSFSGLSLSAGPVLSHLIHNKKFNNAFAADNDNNRITILTVPNPQPAKFLYGGNLALGTKLAKPLELKAGAQYFFNSVYKKGENENADGNDVKVSPFQINLGLSYSLMRF